MAYCKTSQNYSTTHYFTGAELGLVALGGIALGIIAKDVAGGKSRSKEHKFSIDSKLD